ncbi:MAG TPA: hypothetical protein VID47_06055 [Actinomycetota bacterium]|jgi:hypothetical protein
MTQTAKTTLISVIALVVVAAIVVLSAKPWAGKASFISRQRAMAVAENGIPKPSEVSSLLRVKAKFFQAGDADPSGPFWYVQRDWCIRGATRRDYVVVDAHSGRRVKTLQSLIPPVRCGQTSNNPRWGRRGEPRVNSGLARA